MAGRGGARPGAGRKKKIAYTELSDVQFDAPIELIKGRKSFPNEQMAILSRSPHVVSVTKKTISYTLVFKEAFWRRYMQGVMPAKIFREFGIDPDMLGEDRIWGLVASLRDLVAKGLPFTNGRETQPQKDESKAPVIDIEAEDRPDLELKELPKPPRPPHSPRVVIPTVSRDDLQRLSIKSRICHRKWNS